MVQDLDQEFDVLATQISLHSWSRWRCPMGFLVSCIVFGAFILMTIGESSGQEAAKWLVGTWAGTAPSPAGGGMMDRRQTVFREDGTYKTEIQPARGGLITVVGTWKANGDEITLVGTYLATGLPRALTVLRRTGTDQLEGESVSPIDGKRVSISITRMNHDAGPAQPDTYVQKLPDDLRVEFSKNGRSISGYMYNLSGRNPVRMRLRVEGVDAAGKIVTVTRWWIPDIPRHGRAFFQVTVADAPFYQIIVESFSWDKGN